MHQVRRRAEISRIRQAVGQRANLADCSINEIVWLRDHGMRVNGRESPRTTQRCGELVIVIGRARVGVAVERHLDRVLVVMGFAVVSALVEGEGQDRHTGDHPQQ